MQSQTSGHQAPEPRWNAPDAASSPDREADPEVDALRARIDELETIVNDYEVLLEALPDLFERKFQQRLEPLLERYRLLARAQQLLGEADLPLIEQPERQASDNRLPMLERWRQTRSRGQGRSTRNAA
ncbi:hypothetical protein [Synechococcus sp. NOUM97013]|uniref:hypothetical protein n=1 Tax=Synechococcus sp. NOUM97013 TaxID=1442555 RepID=UPI0016493A3A|nr:hypothetical protein [Synechococcus sp. NOUM97013]QNI75001.1 hypothetical protein SynNOUM97013_02967 [Synechococcus sp. NOUM97013]